MSENDKLGWLRQNRTVNKRGEWVPAIPLPLWISFGRKQCLYCNRRFRNEQRYREHYAYTHILGMER